MDWVALPAACVLAIGESAIEPTDTGWSESVHLEVLADGRCPHVDLLLGPGVETTELRVRARLSDGTRRKLGPERFEPLPRDLAGRGALRVHVPELLEGDGVHFDWTRTHPAIPLVWSPPAGTRYASLETSVPVDAGELAIEDGVIWLADATGEAAVALPHPSPVELPQPPEPVTVDASVTRKLIVPGEPMRTLYPGGGSSVAVTWEVAFPSGDGTRGWVLPIPPEAEQVHIEGPHVRRDDSALLLAPDGQASTHIVTWTAPDAPVYGERITLPDAAITERVELDGGRIRWQDDTTWWIGSIGVRAIVPERSALIRSLDRRFRRAAVPEPAIPAKLRATPPDWDFVAALKPELAKRAGVGPTGVAPLFPRRLVKARKSGAITGVEAALTLWLQASQAQMPASWAVVLPASESRGWHTSPAGYTEGLLAVGFDGATRWVDPACPVCAPFEIRPDLEGASMLSPMGPTTPGPREGTMTVIDRDDHRRIELTGPAALELRLFLADLPRGTRRDALANRFGAEAIRGSRGIADLGAPIVLELEGDALPDPLTPPGAWWGWKGPRTWDRPGTAIDDTLRTEGLQWERHAVDGRVQEALYVEERRPAPEEVERLFERRDAPPPEPSVMDPAPEGGDSYDVDPADPPGL